MSSAPNSIAGPDQARHCEPLRAHSTQTDNVASESAPSELYHPIFSYKSNMCLKKLQKLPARWNLVQLQQKQGGGGRERNRTVSVNDELNVLPPCLSEQEITTATEVASNSSVLCCTKSFPCLLYVHYGSSSSNSGSRSSNDSNGTVLHIHKRQIS